MNLRYKESNPNSVPRITTWHPAILEQKIVPKPEPFIIVIHFSPFASDKEDSLFIAIEIDGVDFFVVEVDPSEQIDVVLLYQVLAELVLLQEYWRVVWEQQVEHRNVVRVLVVCQAQRLLPHLEHDEAVVLEEELRGLKCTCSLDLLHHIPHLHVGVLESPLGFQTQGEGGVKFDPGEFISIVRIQPLGNNILLELLKVSGVDLVQVNVRGDRVLQKLGHQGRILIWVFQTWRVVFQDRFNHCVGFLQTFPLCPLGYPIDILLSKNFHIFLGGGLDTLHLLAVGFDGAVPEQTKYPTQSNQTQSQSCIR